MARPLSFILAALVTVALACGSSEETPAAPSGPAAQESGGPVLSLDIEDFVHPDATVAVGTKVVWTNRDVSAQHTVTHKPADPDDQLAFDSGGSDPTRLSAGAQAIRLRRGQTFEHTFTEPGTYEYICLVHPTSMLGTITVTAGGG